MLAPAITTTQTTAVQLAPKVRTALRNELRAYADLKAQVDVLTGKLDTHKTKITDILSSTGESTLRIEGEGRATWVFPTRPVFDKKRFVALGGSLKIYDAATETRPGKAYVKVTIDSSDEPEAA